MQMERLRQQLLEFSARSDDDAIIGKLQQELINMKVGYQKFTRKYEGLFINLRRKELQCRQLHEEVDRQETAMLALQERTRKQVVALQQALTGSVRQTKWRGLSAEKAEALSASIQQLTQANERQQEEVQQADAARRAAEDDAAARRVLLDEANREVDDLRQVLKAKHAISDDERAMHMRLVAKRLVSLSEQLKASKLECLRVARQLNVSRERQALLEKQFRREEQVRADRVGRCTRQQRAVVGQSATEALMPHWYEWWCICLRRPCRVHGVAPW